MKSPPSAEESSPSTVNGRKLRQARLPFKSLTGGTPTAEAAAAEGRKRKLSANGEDVPAPKQNRKEIDADLLSSETLDSSVEYTAALKSKSKSESKENVASIELDDSLSDASSLEPAAKRRLDLGESAKEELITIKLPVGRKSKETAKKSKRFKKSAGSEEKPAEEEEPEEEAPQKDDKQKESESESEAEAEVDPNDTSVLNKSLMSCDEDAQLKTPNGQKMTPRQLARKAESEKRLQERQMAKQEREEQRKREREEKEEQRRKERDEKEEQKRKEREEKDEQRRKEREEKEEQRRKEKEEKEQKRLADLEEKEKKRQAEIDAKNEKKRLQEQQKEEERLKKEQEKRLKEEQEVIKNRKTAAAFVKFFVPKKTDGDAEPQDQMQSTHLFKSFQVKEGMKVAPVIRRQLEQEPRAELEKGLGNPAQAERSQLYLAELKRGDRQPQRRGKTWVAEEAVETNDDLFIIGECRQKRFRRAQLA